MESSPLLSLLRVRAQLLNGIRAYFKQQDILEVETPICSIAGNTDSSIDSMVSRYTGAGAAKGVTLYLHTSPELAMKRLLIAGSGSIYQITKVFRDGELGRLHHPEFTLLEWYRLSMDHHQLMQEVADLVNGLLPAPLAIIKVSYADLFEQFLSINPHTITAIELAHVAQSQQIEGIAHLILDKDAWLDILMTRVIEPHLGQEGLCFVYDYPASQASLARISDDPLPVAQRFELYWQGIELANGFYELNDAKEQRRRFQQESDARSKQGRPIPMDEDFLLDMEKGLPDCSGVALGIDRLLMLMTESEQLNQILAFPLCGTDDR